MSFTHPLYAKVVTKKYSENIYKAVVDEIRFKAETGKIHH